MFEKEFDKIFKFSRNKVDDIEILLTATSSFSTSINKQKIERFSHSDSQGIGVRVLQNGKSGYAYTEKFSDEMLEKIVIQAKENAIYSESDESEEINNYPDIDNKPLLYNEKLENIEVDRKIELLKKMESYAYESDKRVKNIPSAIFGNHKNIIKIANSKGLSKEEKSNMASCYINILAEENQDKKMGLEYIITRNFDEIDPIKLAKKSVEKGISLLNGQTVKTASYPIVFDNEMTADILGAFSNIFSAKAVIEGKSLLKDKIGLIIADKKINLQDNALHPNGLNSYSFDDEGFPGQTTNLIKNGELLSYLHNTKTAKKFKVKSTGNGERSYKSSLNVSLSNLILNPGQTDRKELFNIFPEIIEIVNLQGLHSGANSISGDFSLSAEGFLYRNGERKHALKQFTISGNILDVFKNVVSISNDFKFCSGSIGASSILVRELSVSG